MSISNEAIVSLIEQCDRLNELNDELENGLEKYKQAYEKLKVALWYYEHDGGRDSEDIELIAMTFLGHLIDVETGGRTARQALKEAEEIFK